MRENETKDDCKFPKTCLLEVIMHHDLEKKYFLDARFTQTVQKILSKIAMDSVLMKFSGSGF